MRRIVIWAMSTLTVLVLLLTLPHVPTLGRRDGRGPTSRPDHQRGRRAEGLVRLVGLVAAPKDSSGSSASKTYAGEAVSTRFGNVQVQITVTDGRITASDVLQVPYEDRHDQMINSGAVPIYNDETVQQQSADIDVVSGATVTWEGYTQSLQSAIDAANL